MLRDGYPFKLDLTMSGRKAAVLCRIGRELVQDYCKRLGHLGLDRNMWAVNSNARPLFFQIRSEFLPREGKDVSPKPAALDEQRVGIRERLEAPFYGRSQPFRRISLRQVHKRLNRCEHVSGAMFGFASEHCNSLLGALSLRNVTRNRRGSYNLALKVSNRRHTERHIN